MTTEQVHRRDNQVFLRLGRDEITIPEPLATLLITLTRDNRRYTGADSPTTTWLFPGLLPGRPLTLWLLPATTVVDLTPRSDFHELDREDVEHLEVGR